MSDSVHLSSEAFERLSNELEHLKTHGRIDIAERIERARELGDLRENAEYHAAKEEQGKMEARIGHLSAMLTDAQIVESSGGDAVTIGHVVAIRYEGDDDVEQFLVGSIEEKREGLEVLSPSSPLGKALLGAKAGSTVSFTAPSGASIHVEVVAIDP